MKRYIIFLCSILVAINLFAQKENTSVVVDDNITSYLTAVNEYSVIYSGKEEPIYRNYISNHPYLGTDGFRKGLVSFDGRIYPDLLLRLNQDLGELIVWTPGNRSIMIPKDRIDYAIIESSEPLLLLYHTPESADGSVLPEGFYVRLHNGESQVWKRETAALLSKIVDYQVEYYFAKRSRIYVYMNGTYYPVSSKKSLLKLFSSKKSELKNYIKQSKLNFRKDTENAIVAAAEYFDELNK